MKVVPINNTVSPFGAVWDPVELLCEVLQCQGVSVILFLDDSDSCQSYANSNTWLWNECNFIVVVTEPLMDCFEISKVPSFRFFRKGYEVHEITGTASKSHVQKRKYELNSGGVL